MKKKICLDAGHYGKYNRSKVVPEYYESEMNWKLHNYLAEELERFGLEVIKTRADQTKDMGLVARGKASAGCDLFLSIHSNAADAEYVDYPLVITMQDGKGDALGLALAKNVQVLMGTKQAGKIIKKAASSGKGEWYSVLEGARQVGTMGMIIEHSFHTNEKATRWLLVDANLREMAKAEAEIIAAHLGVQEPVEDSTYYEAFSGPYATKAEAEAVAAKMLEQGYYGAGIREVKPEKPTEPETWTPTVGETVYFQGDKQYSSSDSDTVRGAVAGLAKITAMAPGKKHPYHLQRTGSTGPWGWVDAGTFTKA